MTTPNWETDLAMVGCHHSIACAAQGVVAAPEYYAMVSAGAVANGRRAFSFAEAGVVNDPKLCREMAMPQERANRIITA